MSKKLDLRFILRHSNSDDFIAGAYKEILGRPADDEGLNYYSNRLISGHTRTSVIEQLLKSHEAIIQKKNIHNSFVFFGLLQVSKIKQLKKVANKVLHTIESRIITPTDISLSPVIKSSPIEMKENKTLQRLDQGFEGVHKRLDLAISEIVNIKRDLIIDAESNRLNQKIDAISTRLDQEIHVLYKHLNLTVNEIVNLNRDFINNTKTSKIFVNITSLMAWKTNFVGIIRVEHEVSKILFNKENSVFVCLDTSKGVFRNIPTAHVHEVLSPQWRDGLSSNFDVSTYEETNPSENDIFLTMGLDWDYDINSFISALSIKSKCIPVMFCYDLVPILFPEFTSRDDLPSIFKKHIVDMCHVASLVIAISESTKSDLLDFWEKSEILKQIPSIEVVPLAGNLDNTDTSLVLQNEINQKNHIETLAPFVLYVSSIEPRKNHQLLLNIWRELYEEQGDLCPTLIIAGSSGWNSDEIITSMRLMRAFRADKIIFLNKVSDLFVHWLYKNCQFCVFPSFYEGWGLAVSEAMSYGKICIVSSTGSLNEAAQGLMPSYDPRDFIGWKKEILKLLNDEYREELSSVVNRLYKIRDWAEVAKNVTDIIEKVQTRHTDSKNEKS